MSTIGNNPTKQPKTKTTMAHNIEFNQAKGTYSFVEANKRELAWHRLGQQFDQDGITATEALTACNADFTIAKQPIVALTPEIVNAMESGLPITAEMLEAAKIGGKMATMRMDNNYPLGIVSDNYGIVQNADAFKFIDQLVGGNLDGQHERPVIDAAGILGNGERIFVTAKFPEQIRLAHGDNDNVSLYVVFTTSHDGSGAVNAMVTPVRVVCNNTLNIALRDHNGKLSFRHTSGVMSRLDLTNEENAHMAYRTLNLVDVYTNEFKAAMEQLKSIKLSDTKALDIVRQVLMPKEQYAILKKSGDLNAEGISGRTRAAVEAAEKSLYEGIGQEGSEYEGTGLWVVNGLTTLYQNHSNKKGCTDPNQFFDSVTDGGISMKVQDLYNLVLNSSLYEASRVAATA